MNLVRTPRGTHYTSRVTRYTVLQPMTAERSRIQQGEICYQERWNPTKSTMVEPWLFGMVQPMVNYG